LRSEQLYEQQTFLIAQKKKPACAGFVFTTIADYFLAASIGAAGSAVGAAAGAETGASTGAATGAAGAAGAGAVSSAFLPQATKEKVNRTAIKAERIMIFLQ
jgi:outer membrane lipoprotein SlyB